MSKFNDFLNEQLQDPEVRAEYEALEPEFSIMQAMIDARKSSGMTQKQLSERPVLHRQTSANWRAAVPTRPCGRSSASLREWGCGSKLSFSPLPWDEEAEAGRLR